MATLVVLERREYQESAESVDGNALSGSRPDIRKRQMDDNMNLWNNEPTMYQSEENKKSDNNADNGTYNAPPPPSGPNAVNKIPEGDPPTTDDKLCVNMDEDQPGDFPQI